MKIERTDVSMPASQKSGVRKDSSGTGSGNILPVAPEMVTLSVDHKELIAKNPPSDSIDQSKVEQAKKMLASGELDSRENILEAAEKIVKFGI